MKRFLAMLEKDIFLGVKDVFVLMEIGFAVFMVLLLVFVVPEEIDTENTVFIHDSTGMIERVAESVDMEETQALGDFLVDSRAAVVEGMIENRSALGVVLGMTAQGRIEAELLRQPYTPQGVVDYIELEMTDLFSMLAPGAAGYSQEVGESVRVTALDGEGRGQVPFNQRLLPIVLFFMVGVIGLFSMISLIGQEREEQTLQAYRVTPAGLWSFYASKQVMLLLVGIVTFSILYIPMMGLAGYGKALVIMGLTILMGSSLGAIIGSFFADPMSAIGWVFLALMVLGLPSVSILAPVFSPWFMRLIPSYYTLFGVDAAMFATDARLVWQSALYLAGFVIVLYPLSGLVFANRVKGEV